MADSDEKQFKTKQLNVRLTEAQHELLTQAAHEHYSTPGTWARHALLRAISKDRKVPIRRNVTKGAERTRSASPPCTCAVNGNGVRFDRSSCTVHGGKKAVGT